MPTFEGLRRLDGGTSVVLEYARDHLARQVGTLDGLDAKAATIMGASLVLLGLLLPQLSAASGWEIAFGGLFLMFIAYTLLMAFMAYRVQAWHVGVPARDVVRAMSTKERIAQAAIGLKLLRAYIYNQPLSRQKAARVQRSLVALGLSVIPLAALFILDGVKWKAS